MIYPIYIYGSSILRKECKEIDATYPELGKLIEDMFATMYASEGVGLAAPQIGKDIRLFVVDGTPFEDVDPTAKDFKKVFINPEIYEESEEEVLMNEGCLSVPGIHEDVYRPESIRINYLDENFEEHDEELTGWPARIVQHEYDHLDGFVFTDRLSTIRKTLLRNKLGAMAKGKYSCAYRAKQK
ncbi:MAG: peptide deformylase [Tidjanibacter sp.]|nr:peptide deformylase [Tidjanibacter sp.]MBQ2247384.1 peptide deformylase [Tidjanibacter sp.]